jgi:hypothetical protein
LILFLSLSCLLLLSVEHSRSVERVEDGLYLRTPFFYIFCYVYIVAMFGGGGGGGGGDYR